MMATVQEFLQSLQDQYPDYWTWLQSHATALGNIRELAKQASQGGWQPARFIHNVQGLKSYETWSGSIAPEETVPPVEEAVIDDFLFEPGDSFAEQQQAASDETLREEFRRFLTDNQLPVTLMTFVQEALVKKKPFSQIVAELRQTAEYKAAYPENELRKARGLSWMPEAEIRSYRDEAKRLGREYLGVDVSNTEISNLIGRGTSLRLWEHRLEVNRLVRQWGGAVQQVFEQATGAPLSDERLHAFFDPDMNTPDLDRLYRRSLERGQPASLGFGVRPEEEAALLEQFGLSPEQIFKGYQQIRSEIPRFERLAAIAGYTQGPGAGLFGDISVPGSLLFRAIQLGDPEAIRELQRQSAEGTALFQAGGGPAKSRTGALAGLSVQ